MNDEAAPTAPPSLRPAPLGRRLGGALMDATVVVILTLVLSLVAGVVLGVSEAPDWMMKQAGRVVLLGVWFGYFAVLEARPQGTLGQSSMGLLAADAAGRPLRLGHALLRAAGKLLLFWTWPAVLFNRRRLTGYDWIVGARVVDRRAAAQK